MLSEEVIVKSSPLRAKNNTPMTFQNMNKKTLELNNLGQDVPYLLQIMPSTVATSDAGNGIGYTGIRIRGSDPTRINVTINDIPLNDAESQTVFWVNLPDFASSTSSIQVQRGVGTSTNGAGAFGGTINLETNEIANKFIGFNLSIGSFNTLKLNSSFNTGLLGKFNFTGRASLIQSDGYIDRATADMLAYHLSGTYINKNESLKLNIFSGKEVTYQAWYGLDRATMAVNRTFNYAGTESDPPYSNQVDDYKQTHYQLIYKKSKNNLFFNSALHYTRGKGFYEEYKTAQAPDFYNLVALNFISDTILSTDLVRRRWLDNHFYGFTYSFSYFPSDNKTEFVVGGALNNYQGLHFGEVIWAEAAFDNSAVENSDAKYYESTGDKLDFNTYVKINRQLLQKLNAFIDLQYRYVKHSINGIDNDKRNIDNLLSLHFFNPKAGITFQQNKKTSWYLSYSMANREPSRSDITDAVTISKPVFEKLHDIEFGSRSIFNNLTLNVNTYLMKYDNQLVLTGQINDVGAPIRSNVKNSYRLGLELDGNISFTKWFNANLNATISQNKIINFVEYLDDWDNGGQITINHGNTNIAFSPNLIFGSVLTFKPFYEYKNQLELTLMSKYVSKQYIDNTNQAGSVLDAFFVNDVNIQFIPKQTWAKNLVFTFLVRNIFNEMYESNAWVYRYTSGGQISQLEGLYPQAGRHYFLGIDLKF
jgi:iron complex outermembrane receptor protein